MCAVPHRYRRGARVARKLQIVGRVADHQRRRCLDAGLVHQVQQHVRVRFRMALVGAACRDEPVGEALLRECAREARATLAGRDREQVARGVELVQHLAHAVEQNDLGRRARGSDRGSAR